jgi:membrane-bound lytic murein transglycosylase D
MHVVCVSFWFRLIFLSAFFPAALSRAQLEVDWEGISDAVTTFSEEYEFDPEALRAPTPEEWATFWRTLQRVLQAQSLEDLAVLLPYAEAALEHLDGVERAKPTADWLRQRLDYFRMADDVVREAAIPPPASPVRPSPPTPTPSRPSPPPAKPLPPPRPAAPDKSMEMERWVKRLENRPAPAQARALVPELKAIFRGHGVPEELVWLAEVESSFDPSARSPVGALGLYQFMPATAERFGMQLRPEDERLHPEKSADAAARYLKFLHGRFNSWPLALAAYNAGEGRVGRLLKSHQANSFEEIAPYLPAETRMYVPKTAAVIKLREQAELERL